MITTCPYCHPDTAGNHAADCPCVKPMITITDLGPRWPGETTVEKVMEILNDEKLQREVADGCYDEDIMENYPPISVIEKFVEAVRERIAL